MKLHAQGLTVQYPGQDSPAVNDANLTVESGELVLMAGPNGSGKSTLFSSLIGTGGEVTGGDVTLDGQPISEISRPAFSRVVAALPQSESRIFPLSVGDAVALGRWSRIHPFQSMSRADHDAVAIAVQRTGLQHLVDRGTDTLSGGEWQRVRLARALASEPKLLLLDEPGAALDIAYEMAFFELLRSLVNSGIGVLAITHHLNVAARFADRVILMEDGAIAGTGTPAELLTEELVSRVFDWPIEVELLGGSVPHLVPQRRPLPLNSSSHNTTPTNEGS